MTDKKPILAAITVSLSIILSVILFARASYISNQIELRSVGDVACNRYTTVAYYAKSGNFIDGYECCTNCEWKGEYVSCYNNTERCFHIE